LREGGISKVSVKATQGAQASARAPCRSKGAGQRLNGEILGFIFLQIFFLT